MKRILAAIALGAVITTPALADSGSHWINPAKMTAASTADDGAIAKAGKDEVAEVEPSSRATAEKTAAAAPRSGAWVSPAVLNPDLAEESEAASSDAETTASVTMTATSSQAWISPAVLNGNATGEAEGSDSGSKEGRGVSGKSGKNDNGYHAIIDRHAKAHGIPIAWARAVVHVESRYNARATGRAGEVGLMQLKLRTARGIGYKGSRQALYDPETNIKYGMLYLAKAYQLAGGDLCGTILRYNAGHYAKRMTAGPRRYCGKVRGLIGA